jgi:serine protease Do
MASWHALCLRILWERFAGESMTRGFAMITVALAATVGFLIGIIAVGSLVPVPLVTHSGAPAVPVAVSTPAMPTASPGVTFADIAEQINPAVVNIEAASRPADSDAARRWLRRERRERLEIDPFDDPQPQDPELPRRGAGTGFIIDAEGHILTNNHVIERAERIAVKLADGRTMRATVVGTDPATDIALIKVDGARLPAAPLGDSDELRVGEWVCAIGNPLAWEHTVTVGVVSFIGRQLFDPSLDHYIQTDAAINFGNSGGPLINSRGEVIGINSAISWRASNIGFAIPINQAREILPQLKAQGRVSRGFLGVTLREVDPDLQRSLKLSTGRGALVQDVADGSPGARAGLRTYDLILSVDGDEVTTNTELIRRIASRSPGTVVRLRLVRNGREQDVRVRLAERPSAQDEGAASLRPRFSPRSAGAGGAGKALGLTVTEMDGPKGRHHGVPADVQGVLVSKVEPLSAASDAGIERGVVILEINRQRIASVQAYYRIVGAARPGDVLALYVYAPAVGQKLLRTVRVEEP